MTNTGFGTVINDGVDTDGVVATVAIVPGLTKAVAVAGRIEVATVVVVAVEGDFTGKVMDVGGTKTAIELTAEVEITLADEEPESHRQTWTDTRN